VIEHKIGNILEEDAEALVNCANCVSYMDRTKSGFREHNRRHGDVRGI